MGWREQLREGSFRGVPFKVDTTDGELGRRLAEHVFPGRDYPSGEDMGAAIRRHCLEIYVLGPDYFPARDALIKAFNTPGIAQLMHPFLGYLRGYAGKVRLRESTREGGIARFSFTFTEALERSDFFDTPTYSPGAKANQTADDTATAAKSALAAELDVTGAAFVLNAALDLLGGSRAAAVTSVPVLSTYVAGATPGNYPKASFLGSLTKRLGGLSTDIATMSEVNARLAKFSNELSSLIRSPFNLAAEVVGIIGDARDWVRQPLDALTLYRDLSFFGTEFAAIVGTSPAQVSLRGNSAALVQVVRVSAAAEGARQTSLLSYASSRDALAVRDEWAAIIDDLREEADGEVFRALSDLKAALVFDLTERGARLPELRSITLPGTVPGLVLANRLYGHSGAGERSTEIAARNGVGNPLFLPQGVPLEVLSV